MLPHIAFRKDLRPVEQPIERETAVQTRADERRGDEEPDAARERQPDKSGEVPFASLLFPYY